MKIRVKNCRTQDNFYGRKLDAIVQRVFGKTAVIYPHTQGEGERSTVCRPCKTGGYDVIGAIVWYRI